MSKPRGVLIAGNWKMNHSQAETDSFFTTLRSTCESALGRYASLFKSEQLQAIVIPPSLSLERAKHAAEKLSFPLTVAAQNAQSEKKGAFTGEISGPMLQEIGIHWILVGHSERRQYFCETDEVCRKKTESLLEQGFRVILCVGETRAEREAGKTSEVLTRQLNAVFVEKGKGAAAALDGKLVIAYEPVWAIGTGLTATPAQAEEAHQLIRKLLWDRFGMEASGRTSLLYGGSVTPENVDSLLACANVDGALVGGASLKADSYLALLVAGGKASS